MGAWFLTADHSSLLECVGEFNFSAAGFWAGLAKSPPARVTVQTTRSPIKTAPPKAISARLNALALLAVSALASACITPQAAFMGLQALMAYPRAY